MPSRPNLSLASFDTDLRARLAALDDATLRDAWHRATERHETLAAIQKAVADFDERAQAYALDVLAQVDLHEAVRLADRFLAIPEIASASWSETHLFNRRQRAAQILHRAPDALIAEDLARAVAFGRIVLDVGGLYDRAKARVLWDHPDLQTPARRFAALEIALAASAEAPRRDYAGTLVSWLQLRLVEEPHVAGTDAIVVHYRRATEGGAPAGSWGDMLVATGDRAAIELVASALGTPGEDTATIAAVFALDPQAAFDRLGARLDPEALAGRGARLLLDVLAQDGPRTTALTGWASARPQGWVRADRRWIATLLRVREHDDPNFSHPAKRALKHADLDLVLAALPKPKKKLPPIALAPLGELAFARGGYPRPPVWLGAGLVVVADSARTLAAHRLEAGLPRAFTIALPQGVSLPAARAGFGEDPWEVPGLYDVALRPDGAIALGAQTADHEHLVALFNPAGKPIAEHRFGDGAAFPHTLAFGAGAVTLWVACVGDDGHLVAAFDPARLAPIGEASIGAFPPPAWIEAHPHPTEDVAVFSAHCGQDGAWLKVVERSPKPKRRKQKLDGKQSQVPLLGYSPDGTIAAFATGATLSLRPWPSLDKPKKKRIQGHVVGGGVCGGRLVMAVAEVSDAPSALVAHAFPDGEQVAQARYPIGEVLVSIGEGVLVTAKAEGQLVVHRVGAA